MMPGPVELVVILVIVLIIFGPGKLPAVFGSLGSGIKAFKDAQKDTGELDVTPADQITEDDASVQDAEVVNKD